MSDPVEAPAIGPCVICRNPGAAHLNLRGKDRALCVDCIGLMGQANQLVDGALGAVGITADDRASIYEAWKAGSRLFHSVKARFGEKPRDSTEGAAGDAREPGSERR